MTTVCFEDLFRASKGKPVEYGGQVICMVDNLPLAEDQSIRVRFESANSEWRQGIHIAAQGWFDVNGRLVENAIVLWMDTAPKEVAIRIKTKSGTCAIKNVWDVGDGVMHFWHAGGAMIVEQFPGARRYRCNDGITDDDFDDLIFAIFDSNEPSLLDR